MIASKPPKPKRSIRARHEQPEEPKNFVTNRRKFTDLQKEIANLARIICAIRPRNRAYLRLLKRALRLRSAYCF